MCSTLWRWDLDHSAQYYLQIDKFAYFLYLWRPNWSLIKQTPCIWKYSFENFNFDYMYNDNPNWSVVCISILELKLFQKLWRSPLWYLLLSRIIFASLFVIIDPKVEVFQRQILLLPLLNKSKLSVIKSGRHHNDLFDV